MNGAGEGGPSQPLSNDDFRRMLATPRPDSQPRQKQGGAKKKGRPHKGPSQKPVDDAEDAAAGPGYRDRALERRQGLGPELTGVPQDLVSLINNDGETALHGVSYEESKYLGGDVAHTHLVKGLDFALLQKVRAEEQREAEEEEDSDREDSGDEAPGPQQAAAGRRAAPFVPRHIAPPASAPKARTAMAAALHEYLFAPKPKALGITAAEMFQPRRTSFLYEAEGGGLENLPTTLHRAKEDCPKVKETLQGDLDARILERLVKIMAYMSAASGAAAVKKKVKKKLHLQGTVLPGGVALAGSLRPDRDAAALKDGAGPDAEGAGQPGSPSHRPAPVDDDENIFDDDGEEYKPERRAPGAAPVPPLPGPAGRGAYFGGAEEGQLVSPTQGVGLAGPSGATEFAPPPPPLPPLGHEEEEEEGAYPDTSAQYPDTSAQYPDTSAQYPDTTAQYPDTSAQYPDTSAQYPDTSAQYPVAQTSAPAETGVAFYLEDDKASDQMAAEDKPPAKKPQKLVLQDADDGYAECYPNYFDAAGTVVDSEGEDEKAGEVILSRLDFDSQAEWEAYSASLKPQVAGKGANPRKAQRERNKEAIKNKNKMEAQLGQIRDLMEKKGQSHDKAFEKVGDRASTQPSTLGGPTVPQKKRRI
ncbi:hypothetical protein ACKKBF_B30485 [Auxenochlorella protothecoides x Auxenochlorella symbiontica]